MTNNVLIAYASKHNSTAEIASTIGAVLQRVDKLEVDIRSVEQVEGLDDYPFVVLGSAIYAGQWQPAAADFLRRYEQELTQRLVWLFSSGPTGDGDPQVLLKGWQSPQALTPIIARIQPQSCVLFHGKLDPKNLNFLERLLVKGIHAPVGDFRDWDAIRQWAMAIAGIIAAAVAR